jgi:hypothetical protein
MIAAPISPIWAADKNPDWIIEGSYESAVTDQTLFAENLAGIGEKKSTSIYKSTHFEYFRASKSNILWIAHYTTFCGRRADWRLYRSVKAAKTAKAAKAAQTIPLNSKAAKDRSTVVPLKSLPCLRGGT